MVSFPVLAGLRLGVWSAPQPQQTVDDQPGRWSVATIGCGDISQEPTSRPQTGPAEGPQVAGQKTEERAEKAGEGGQAGDQAREEAKKARQRQRKLAELQRSLEVAKLKLAKAKIALEHGELRHQQALAKAEKEFELSKRKLEIFTEVTVPNRVARAELGLQSAEDGQWEAQEELRQLELMYSQEQFADQTKEIVIERARRRLERTGRDLELKREELRTLVEISLPLERMEHELEAQRKKQAVLELHWDNEAALIDRQVAVLTAEAEVAKLENELADLREEIEQAEAASQPADHAAPQPNQVATQPAGKEP